MNKKYLEYSIKELIDIIESNQEKIHQLEQEKKRITETNNLFVKMVKDLKKENKHLKLLNSINDLKNNWF